MRRPGGLAYRTGVAHTYPPLNVEVRTPRLTLAGASDELLERLVPLVRAGIADAEPWPFDDPISFYAESPEREWRWLRGIWAGRGRVSPDSWRLYFAVLVDGEPVGMQDLTGSNFTQFGTVTSFSWPAPGSRGQGLGKEMRAAILHLAFAGLRARSRQRRLRRQRSVQPRFPWPGLRTERHGLGHPPRRARADPAVAAHPGRVGTGPPRRHRADRRRGVPAGPGHRPAAGGKGGGAASRGRWDSIGTVIPRRRLLTRRGVSCCRNSSGTR